MPHALARRAALCLAFAALAAPAMAADAPVSLFRIVTQRDAVTIGLTAAELAALGSGEAVTLIAQKLQKDGQITVWQYASGRAADGSLAFKPLARIAVMRADSLRVEPYTAALPVLAPQ